MTTNTLTKEKQNILTKPIIVAIAAVICCGLWGSAFPASRKN